MRRQKIRLYCQSCKQTAVAELLPEFAMCQTDKEVALKQYVHISCPKCDADFSMPKLFERIAQQLKAQMALGEAAYDFACREIRNVLAEQGYTGEMLRKLTTECATETEWSNPLVMQRDIPQIVETYLEKTGREVEK